jgi:hypothetical protein
VEHANIASWMLERDKFNMIYTKLKTTKFKDNVMKECRELFFDEDFTKAH